MQQQFAQQQQAMEQQKQQRQEQAELLKAQLAEMQAALKAEAEQENLSLVAEHAQAENLAQELISKLRNNQQQSAEWRLQAQQMLSSAPVEITYDIGQQAEKDAQERFRLRLRPSVLAGLMLCAGVAGAGFANFSTPMSVANAMAAKAAPVVASPANVTAPSVKLNSGMQLSYELTPSATQVKKSAENGIAQQTEPVKAEEKAALQLAMAAK